jgi:hypothetical protein
MGWSRQRPARKATERDDEAIERWVNDRWPRVKDARARDAWIVSQDESGFSLPSVRSTWAPKRQTPVLHHHFNWKRLSMSAAVCFRPDGTEASLVFGMQPGAYNDESLMESLTELNLHLDGDKVTLVWDGLPSHTIGEAEEIVD